MAHESAVQWGALLLAGMVVASTACGGKTRSPYSETRGAEAGAWAATVVEPDAGPSGVAGAAGAPSAGVTDGGAGSKADSAGRAGAGGYRVTEASAGMGGRSDPALVSCPDPPGYRVLENALPNATCPGETFEVVPLSTCELTAPASSDPTVQLNLDNSELLLTPDPDEPDGVQLLPHLAQYDECAGVRDGWLYDPPDAPSRILLCPCACEALRTGTVQLFWPCNPGL